MKNNKKVEVVLFIKYSFADPRQKELVRWLGTTLQSVIVGQQLEARRLFLSRLIDTPPIYLS